MRPTFRRSRIGGFTLLEVAGATVMLATAMVITAQVLTLRSAQAREVERRQLAGQEAANLLERLTAVSWDKLSSQPAATQQLSRDTKSRLPDGTLTVAIERGTEAPASKRITVEIGWRNRSGELTSPVRLSAWLFAPEATE